MASQMKQVQQKATELAKFIIDQRRKIPEMLPIKLQIQQLEGLDVEYPSQQHQTLLKGLNITSQSYNNTSNWTQKKQIASMEMQLWKTFLETRQIPPEYQLSNGHVENFQQIWKDFTPRNAQDIQTSNFLSFWYEYIKKWKMNIPLDERCLLQLVHPYWGYLTRMEHSLSFNAFCDFLKMNIMATYERSIGLEYFARQITCLSYWSLVDKQMQGYLDFNNFQKLMKAFWIETQKWKDLEDVQNEFKFCLRKQENELKPFSKEDTVFRFDLARKMFIERDL